MCVWCVWCVEREVLALISRYVGMLVAELLSFKKVNIYIINVLMHLHMYPTHTHAHTQITYQTSESIFLSSNFYDELL